MLLFAATAYNEEVRSTLRDARLQEVLLKIDGAANREQVRWHRNDACVLMSCTMF